MTDLFTLRTIGSIFATGAAAVGLASAQPGEKNAVVTAEASRAAYQQAVAPILAKHCGGCHGAKTAKGDLDLGKLDPDMKASTSAARWVVVLDRVVMGDMPPEGKPRPTNAEIQELSNWIHGEMKRSGKHLARRAAYANGNKAPHQLLFDPKNASPFAAGAQVRRLSPEIYAGFTGELAKGLPLAQPFSPGGGTTFKDMGAPKVDEPVTALLIRNALSIVERQTAFKIEDGAVKAVGGTPKEFLLLLDEKKPATDAEVGAAIKVQFERVVKRAPTKDELSRFTALYRKTVQDSGAVIGARTALAGVFLLPETVFRWEVGAGAPDAQGRVRLTGREIAFGLAYALTDSRPPDWLLAEADQGKLDSRDGVAAAIRRMLDDPKLAKPRILRFFQEYFGYEAAREVFKNDKDNPEHDPRALVEDTNRLVEYVLEQDRDVLKELLTTNKSFVAYKTAATVKKQRAEAIAKFEAEKAKDPEKFKTKKAPKVGRSVYEAYNLTDFPDQQPVELPAAERAGILTQPAWLVAMSTSDDNHAIHRGKWVRERLLGNVVPDIPITVDAQLPQAPEKTLRERMLVTHETYCYKCHQLMNPVGLPFEMFDHFGRHRTEEKVFDAGATEKNRDAKGKPLGPVQRGVAVNASGRIDLVGDAALDADVKDAVDMIRKLAATERVEQVFIRHAFRYWTGRNETLGDAPSLQAVQKAYRDSQGSMKALIVALLSSDSFLYRVPTVRE